MTLYEYNINPIHIYIDILLCLVRVRICNYDYVNNIYYEGVLLKGVNEVVGTSKFTLVQCIDSVLS